MGNFSPNPLKSSVSPLFAQAEKEDGGDEGEEDEGADSEKFEEAAGGGVDLLVGDDGLDFLTFLAAEDEFAVGKLGAGELFHRLADHGIGFVAFGDPVRRHPLDELGSDG